METGIGFNFINNFIPLDTEIGDESPFQFYFNRCFKQSVTRIAIGVDLGGSIEKIDDDNRDISQRGIDFNLRLGAGKRREISNKFHFVSGGDFLLGFDYSNVSVSDVNNPQVNNNRKSFKTDLGAGFFGGFQYYFTSRLSLYTEMSYVFVVDYTSSNLEFDSITRDDVKESKFEYGTRYLAPSYLVLFYRF